MVRCAEAEVPGGRSGIGAEGFKSWVSVGLGGAVRFRGWDLREEAVERLACLERLTHQLPTQRPLRRQRRQDLAARGCAPATRTRLRGHQRLVKAVAARPLQHLVPAALLAHHQRACMHELVSVGQSATICMRACVGASNNSRLHADTDAGTDAEADAGTDAGTDADADADAPSRLPTREIARTRRQRAAGQDGAIS